MSVANRCHEQDGAQRCTIDSPMPRRELLTPTERVELFAFPEAEGELIQVTVAVLFLGPTAESSNKGYESRRPCPHVGATLSQIRKSADRMSENKGAHYGGGESRKT